MRRDECRAHPRIDMHPRRCLPAFSRLLDVADSAISHIGRQRFVCSAPCAGPAPGYAAKVSHYVDSEVAQLKTVLLHRPGPELARLTPRNNDSLLFDGIPWVGRAQEEHDIFADALRSRGVTVLYLSELLAQVLALEPARKELTEAVLADVRLGDSLRRRVADHLAGLDPADLATALMAGIAHEELQRRRRPGLRPDGPARLRHRPAAEPAVHPRLQPVGRRPRRRHQPGDAGPGPGDHADPGDLSLPPDASPAPRCSTSQDSNISKVATCCCSRPA